MMMLSGFFTLIVSTDWAKELVESKRNNPKVIENNLMANNLDLVLQKSAISIAFKNYFQTFCVNFAIFLQFFHRAVLDKLVGDSECFYWDKIAV